MNKTLRLASLALIATLSLTACHTMEGMGEDIQKGGKKIEKEADQNRNY